MGQGQEIILILINLLCSISSLHLPLFRSQAATVFKKSIVFTFSHVKAYVSKIDLGLSSTCLTGQIRSCRLFNGKNVKIRFLKRFVTCDLKIGRYRQFIELIKLCAYSRSMSLIYLGQMSCTY